MTIEPDFIETSRQTHDDALRSLLRLSQSYEICLETSAELPPELRAEYRQACAAKLESIRREHLIIAAVIKRWLNVLEG